MDKLMIYVMLLKIVLHDLSGLGWKIENKVIPGQLCN